MKGIHSDFLIDRLASSIVDESLPLKEVERELRGMVADIAVRQRGLAKKEVASRCGVTEKSIENYLKDSRSNPKSPEREVARVLQDQALSLEEVYDIVFPVLCQERHFTLDDAKRALDKLLMTGEVVEHTGRTYRAVKQPAIRCPMTDEAYRELVDQKARDLDYIVLNQKSIRKEELSEEKLKRFSRVVNDTNLVRIDFTVDIDEDEMDDFYEKLTKQVAKMTLKYEKKQGKSRIRLLLGMRSVSMLLLMLGLTAMLVMAPRDVAMTDESWELDDADPAAAPRVPRAPAEESWELDNVDDDKLDPNVADDETLELEFNGGGAGDEGPFENLPTPKFIRGDTNIDLSVDLSDSIVLLRHLFLADVMNCEDSGDADDSGLLTVADALIILEHVILGSGPPEIFLGGEPDFDATPDGLDCTVGIDGE
jgi:transcriptional regulator with XRE-family HTH domain